LVVAQVVRHWNQIILDLRSWAALGQVSDYPASSVVTTKG